MSGWIDRRKQLLNESISRFKTEIDVDDPPHDPN